MQIEKKVKELNINQIMVLGDLMCSDDIVPFVKKCDFEYLLGKELYDLLVKENQFVTVNLESPITKTVNKDKKGGSPNLKSDPCIINFLNEIPYILTTGANNHISDYGKQGIIDTENILDRNNIPHIGFSSDYSEDLSEKKTYKFTSGGYKYEFFSIAQNEFSTIRSVEGKYGADPYDPLTTFDELRKSDADNIIVLFHGGKEYYQYPSPDQKKICRKMIDCGAKAVICQHSHCVGCIEEYKSGIIIYGTGNFLFNFENDSEMSRSSIIPILSFKDGKACAEYIPLKKTNQGGICIASGEYGDEIIKAFLRRSEEIRKDGFVENMWKKYCLAHKYIILGNAITRFPRSVNALERRLGYPLTKLLIRKMGKNLILLNYIRCEVINEMMRTILKEITMED